MTEYEIKQSKHFSTWVLANHQLEPTSKSELNHSCLREVHDIHTHCHQDISEQQLIWNHFIEKTKVQVRILRDSCCGNR